MISVIFSFRDRETDRVERCLESLAQQEYKDFEVIFVDYGSQQEFVKDTKALVERFLFCEYIYTDTRGFPWNRSAALNIGIRRAKGDYIMTTDVDMIYPVDFLKQFATHADPNKVFHIYHYLLPPGFSDWDNLDKYQNLPSAYLALGACHFIHRDKILHLQGFDEFYCYWGVEDRDLNHREKLIGLSVEMLEDYTYMHHQWHAPANYATAGFMPDGFWARLESHNLQLQHQAVRNNANWGSILETPSRPVFEFIDPQKMTLKNSDKLHYLDLSPIKNSSITGLFKAFNQLKSGEAIAIENAFYPNRNRFIQWGIDIFNKIMRVTKIGSEISYNQNVLHGSLYPFIMDNQALIKDYYLNLNVKNGVSVIVKR